MKIIALVLLFVVYGAVEAGSTNCGQLKHSLRWFEIEISKQEDIVIRGIDTRDPHELDKLIEMRDLFLFWTDKRKQNC